MSSSKLSATAAAWVPPAPVAAKQVQGSQIIVGAPTPNTSAQQPQEQQQQQQQLPDHDGQAADWEGEHYEDENEDYWGYYDEEGKWVAYEDEEQQEEGDQQQPRSQQQHRQHQQPQQTGAEQSVMGAEDAVALLHSCYPTHPRSLLQQLLDACDSDMQQAARILSDMDFEQRRTRIAAAAAASRADAAATNHNSSSRGPAGKKQFDYQLEQFPALGGAPSSSTPSGNQPAGSSSGSSRQSNWAAVTSKAPAPAPAAAAGSKLSQVPTRPQLPAAAASMQRLRGDDDGGVGGAVPWVETGAAVSREYAAARAEASDHARVRNACFHHATIAYLAGDKALAKELSAKGRAAADAMWAAHEQASSQIYEQRNTRLQQQQQKGASGVKGGSAAPVIDLHGLHVQEMMQRLPQQIAAFQKQGHPSVSVIVGVGHHTKGPPAARMRPAVEALVKELGYSITEPTPGLLKVRLR